MKQIAPVQEPNFIMKSTSARMAACQVTAYPTARLYRVKTRNSKVEF